MAADAAEAVAAASAGQIATLILPADVSWTDGAQPAPAIPARPPSPVPGRGAGRAAKALRGGEPALILLGGTAVRRPGLEAASRIAAATGARLLAETFPARMERGAGLPGPITGWPTSPRWPCRTGRDPAPDPGRRQGPRILLRLPGPAQLAGAGRLPGARACGRRR